MVKLWSTSSGRYLLKVKCVIILELLQSTSSVTYLRGPLEVMYLIIGTCGDIGGTDRLQISDGESYQPLYGCSSNIANSVLFGQLCV